MKILLLLGLLATVGLSSCHLVNTPAQSKTVSNTSTGDKIENSSSGEAQQVSVFLPPQGPLSDGPVPPVDPPKKIQQQPDGPKHSEPKPPVVWKPASWQPKNPVVSSGESRQPDTPVDPEPLPIDGYRILQKNVPKPKESPELDPVASKPHDKLFENSKEQHIIAVASETSKVNPPAQDAPTGESTPSQNENINGWGFGPGPVVIPEDDPKKKIPNTTKIPLAKVQGFGPGPVIIPEDDRKNKLSNTPKIPLAKLQDSIQISQQHKQQAHLSPSNKRKNDKKQMPFTFFKDQQEIRFQDHNQRNALKQQFQHGNSKHQHGHELKHSQSQDSHWQHTEPQKQERQPEKLERIEFTAHEDRIQWEQREKQRQQEWQQHKQQWQHRSNWEKWQKKHGPQFN